MPQGDLHRYVTIDEVALPHWSTDPDRPWRGVSPLANLTSQLAANTQAVLNREAQAKSGYAMPWMNRPQAGGAAGQEQIAQGTANLQQSLRGDGGLHAMGSTGGFVGRSSSQLYQQSGSVSTRLPN